MTDQNILRRLAYIKYLYKAGIEQAKQPEVISYTALLSFHDSIEWFMNLACLKLGISDKDKKKIVNKQLIALMDYFTIIPGLNLGSSVEKINKRRNNLKHDFQIPSKIELEECASITTLFFEENTRLIFLLEFSNISLLDLIVYEKIRNYLKEADTLKNTNISNAVFNVSISFSELLNIEMEDRTGNKGIFPNTLRSIEWNIMPDTNLTTQDNDMTKIKRELRGITGSYNENFKKLDESLRIISLGIDYRKYTKFKLQVPNVYKNQEEVYKMSATPTTQYLTTDDVQFFIDFVLDCSLKIQEFEYK